ncbi:unnamed protein product [Pleuronectes platessa]|uniref:Uncharacterized protein n=1 Tax=Pleuronectes platessa TaxID=8262 RepID=A0A9N7VXT8_PLEPL|nr:unnamed protein product [Pleuronectes platessa]
MFESDKCGAAAEWLHTDGAVHTSQEVDSSLLLLSPPPPHLPISPTSVHLSFLPPQSLDCLALAGGAPIFGGCQRGSGVPGTHPPTPAEPPHHPADPALLSPGPGAVRKGGTAKKVGSVKRFIVRKKGDKKETELYVSLRMQEVRHKGMNLPMEFNRPSALDRP